MNSGKPKSLFQLLDRLVHRKKVAALICILVPVAGAAQVQSLSFNSLTTEDGLSQGNINAISQDHEGLIQIATKDGSNQFDGYEVTPYHKTY